MSIAPSLWCILSFTRTSLFLRLPSFRSLPRTSSASLLRLSFYFIDGLPIHTVAHLLLTLASRFPGLIVSLSVSEASLSSTLPHIHISVTRARLYFVSKEPKKTKKKLPLYYTTSRPASFLHLIFHFSVGLWCVKYRQLGYRCSQPNI